MSGPASQSSTPGGATLPAQVGFRPVDVAVVTGAGRIGREIARRLAGRGYAVLVTDVSLEGAEETARELGDPAWAMALDVRTPRPIGPWRRPPRSGARCGCG